MFDKNSESFYSSPPFLSVKKSLPRFISNIAGAQVETTPGVIAKAYQVFGGTVFRADNAIVKSVFGQPLIIIGGNQ